LSLCLLYLAVHRFTHRVARGLLIALGRPDGRLSCLSKSEASLLLSAKQAAFIRNPDYDCDGSGPEFITVGHNPFQPNLGFANHIVLPSTEDSTTVANYQAALVAKKGRFSIKPGYSSTSAIISKKRMIRRRKFVDEYLYDRLYYATKPFSVSILRSLRRSMESGSTRIASNSRDLNASIISTKLRKPKGSDSKIPGKDGGKHHEELLPYGTHHIDPIILMNSDEISNSVFSEFVMDAVEILRQRARKAASEAGDKPTKRKTSVTGNMKSIGFQEKSFDPAVRLAFSSKLDSSTRQVQDLQVIVQQFYECRIASLERYLAFCVMFHTMAAACSKPWFLFPWDIARSQSNLRVATTASPISASTSDSHEVSQEIKKIARNMAFKFRNFQTNF
jgi:hypothetical protein